MMNKTELKRKFIQLLLLFSIPINATSFDLAVVRVAKVPAKALYVTQPEGEENRLFVVNQKGLIHIIENGEVKRKPFLWVLMKLFMVIMVPIDLMVIMVIV